MKISIQDYATLIKAIPVREQSFTIQAKHWQTALNEKDFLKIFEGEESICLNHQDVHDTNNLELFILKTILWGYPKGMRGDNFKNIYKNINSLAEVLNVSERRFLKMEDLSVMQDSFQRIKGLGLSTYSKLLYFRDFTFDGVCALILDERLIRVFKNGMFQEFESLSKVSQHNATKMYKTYLQIMKELSQELNISGEQLEQFLFLFGNHLKPIKAL